MGWSGKLRRRLGVAGVDATSTTTGADLDNAVSPPANQAEVRVLQHLVTMEGVAGRTADQLHGAPASTSPKPGTSRCPDVTATTVYYSDAAGEQATAEAVGKNWRTGRAARSPQLADQPPGVDRSLVTG